MLKMGLNWALIVPKSLFLSYRQYLLDFSAVVLDGRY